MQSRKYHTVSLRSALLLAMLLFSTQLRATTIPNLSLIKKQLIEYHDSGSYEAELDSTIKKAMLYLQFRITQNARLSKPGALGLVMSIDETALSNYPDFARLDFGGTITEQQAAKLAGHSPAISYTLSLYNYAKEHGIAVFFITNRSESMRNQTINNLQNAGYKNWNGLIMKPNNYAQRSISPFRTAARKKIIRSGYDIVINLGSQASDLDGNFADMDFQLPNPFYMTP